MKTTIYEKLWIVLALCALTSIMITTSALAADALTCRQESLTNIFGTQPVNGPAFPVTVNKTATTATVSTGLDTYALTLKDQVGDWAFWFASADSELWYSDIILSDTVGGQRVRRFHVGPVRGSGFIWSRVPNEAVFKCQ